MMSILNNYGDKPFFIAIGHGADISSQRADDLDLMALERLASCSNPVAIDIACGAGGQAIRMARLGATVIAIDIADMGQSILSNAVALNDTEPLRIQFIQLDMRFLDTLTEADLQYVSREKNKVLKADIIICQRAIHYFTYLEAVVILAKINQIMAEDGRLYISASGINSELGNDYAGTTMFLDNRYSELSLAMRDKHGIHGRVCLYSEIDMTRLIENSGFSIEALFSSPFGNIKAVAKKRNAS